MGHSREAKCERRGMPKWAEPRWIKLAAKYRFVASLDDSLTRAHTECIKGVVVVDDWLFTGSWDAYGKLWHVETGALLQVMKGHRQDIIGVCGTKTRLGSTRFFTSADSVRCWDPLNVRRASFHTPIRLLSVLHQGSSQPHPSATLCLAPRVPLACRATASRSSARAPITLRWPRPRTSSAARRKARSRSTRSARRSRSWARLSRAGSSVREAQRGVGAAAGCCCVAAAAALLAPCPAPQHVPEPSRISRYGAPHSEPCPSATSRSPLPALPAASLPALAARCAPQLQVGDARNSADRPSEGLHGHRPQRG